MPLDRFENVRDVTAQGRRASAVVASASEVTEVAKALWIGTAGTITGIPVDGSSSVSFTNVPIGVFDAVRFKVISACPANTIAVF